MGLVLCPVLLQRQGVPDHPDSAAGGPGEDDLPGAGQGEGRVGHVVPGHLPQDLWNQGDPVNLTHPKQTTLDFSSYRVSFIALHWVVFFKSLLVVEVPETSEAVFMILNIIQ